MIRCLRCLLGVVAVSALMVPEGLAAGGRLLSASRPVNVNYGGYNGGFGGYNGGFGGYNGGFGGYNRRYQRGGYGYAPVVYGGMPYGAAPMPYGVVPMPYGTYGQVPMPYGQGPAGPNPFAAGSMALPMMMAGYNPYPRGMGPPLMQLPTDPAPGTIVFNVPDNSLVWINDHLLPQVGSRREYVTPTLPPGGADSFAIRVRWTDKAGKTQNYTKHVTVHAGKEANVTVFGN